MKIHAKSAERTVSVIVPTALLTSPHLLSFGYWVVKKTSSQYADGPMPDMDAKTLKRLCDELKRIKKKYGRYQLVEVTNAQGETVTITL